MTIEEAVRRAVSYYGLRNIKETGPLCYWYWCNEDLFDTEIYEVMDDFVRQYDKRGLGDNKSRESEFVEDFVRNKLGYKGCPIKIVDPLANIVDRFLKNHGYLPLSEKTAIKEKRLEENSNMRHHSRRMDESINVDKMGRISRRDEYLQESDEACEMCGVELTPENDAGDGICINCFWKLEQEDDEAYYASVDTLENI